MVIQSTSVLIWRNIAISEVLMGPGGARQFHDDLAAESSQTEEWFDQFHLIKARVSGQNERCSFHFLKAISSRALWKGY